MTHSGSALPPPRLQQGQQQQQWLPSVAAQHSGWRPPAQTVLARAASPQQNGSPPAQQWPLWQGDRWPTSPRVWPQTVPPDARPAGSPCQDYPGAARISPTRRVQEEDGSRRLRVLTGASDNRNTEVARLAARAEALGQQVARLRAMGGTDVLSPRTSLLRPEASSPPGRGGILPGGYYPGSAVRAIAALTVRGVTAVAIGDTGTVYGPSDDPGLVDGINVQWDRRRDGGTRRINVLPADVRAVGSPAVPPSRTPQPVASPPQASPGAGDLPVIPAPPTPQAATPSPAPPPVLAQPIQAPAMSPPQPAPALAPQQPAAPVMQPAAPVPQPAAPVLQPAAPVLQPEVAAPARPAEEAAGASGLRQELLDLEAELRRTEELRAAGQQQLREMEERRRAEEERLAELRREAAQEQRTDGGAAGGDLAQLQHRREEEQRLADEARKAVEEATKEAAAERTRAAEAAQSAADAARQEVEQLEREAEAARARAEEQVRMAEDAERRRELAEARIAELVATHKVHEGAVEDAQRRRAEGEQALSEMTRRQDAEAEARLELRLELEGLARRKEEEETGLAQVAEQRAAAELNHEAAMRLERHGTEERLRAAAETEAEAQAGLESVRRQREAEQRSLDEVSALRQEQERRMAESRSEEQRLLEAVESARAMVDEMVRRRDDEARQLDELRAQALSLPSADTPQGVVPVLPLEEGPQTTQTLSDVVTEESALTLPAATDAAAQRRAEETKLQRLLAETEAAQAALQAAVQRREEEEDRVRRLQQEAEAAWEMRDAAASGSRPVAAAAAQPPLSATPVPEDVGGHSGEHALSEVCVVESSRGSRLGRSGSTSPSASASKQPQSLSPTGRGGDAESSVLQATAASALGALASAFEESPQDHSLEDDPSGLRAGDRVYVAGEPGQLSGRFLPTSDHDPEYRGHWWVRMDDAQEGDQMKLVPPAQLRLCLSPTRGMRVGDRVTAGGLAGELDRPWEPAVGEDEGGVDDDFSGWWWVRLDQPDADGSTVRLTRPQDIAPLLSESSADWIGKLQGSWDSRGDKWFVSGGFARVTRPDKTTDTYTLQESDGTVLMDGHALLRAGADFARWEGGALWSRCAPERPATAPVSTTVMEASRRTGDWLESPSTQALQTLATVPLQWSVREQNALGSSRANARRASSVQRQRTGPSEELESGRLRPVWMSLSHMSNDGSRPASIIRGSSRHSSKRGHPVAMGSHDRLPSPGVDKLATTVELPPIDPVPGLALANSLGGTMTQEDMWWKLPVMDVDEVTYQQPPHGDPPGATMAPPIGATISFDLDAPGAVGYCVDGVQQRPIGGVQMERNEYGVLLLFPDDDKDPVPDRCVFLPHSAEEIVDVVAGVASLCAKQGVPHRLQEEYEALANQERLVERFLTSGDVPWDLAGRLKPQELEEGDLQSPQGGGAELSAEEKGRCIVS